MNSVLVQNMQLKVSTVRTTTLMFFHLWQRLVKMPPLMGTKLNVQYVRKSPELFVSLTCTVGLALTRQRAQWLQQRLDSLHL
jgi:hypothetical protein